MPYQTQYGTTYDTGPVDPMYRYRQLDQLAGMAQLMMQVAEQRRQKELARYEERVKMASAAVAGGADVSDPAIQSVLADLRTADQKRMFRKEGLAEKADLLQTAWATAEKDPTLIAMKAQQEVQRKAQEFAQSFQAGMGTGMGINASQPAPSMMEAYMHGVENTPNGVAALRAEFGAPTAARMMEPTLYRDPPKPDEPPAAVQHEEQMLAWYNSGDPTKKRRAEQFFDFAPPPKAPGAGRAPSTASTPEERAANNTLDAIRDELEADYAAKVSAWKDEGALTKPDSYTPEQATARMSTRPKRVNIEALARKIHQVRTEMPEQSSEIEEVLRQAAEEGQLERAWQSLQRQRGLLTRSAG